MIKLMLIAGAGGFIGTCARFLLTRGSLAIFGTAFPAGTMIVNVLGCFAIGALLALAERGTGMTSGQAAMLITGFCGGFTTFSTFAADIVALGVRSSWTMMVVYTLGTVVIGIGALLAGRRMVNTMIYSE